MFTFGDFPIEKFLFVYLCKEVFAEVDGVKRSGQRNTLSGETLVYEIKNSHTLTKTLLAFNKLEGWRRHRTLGAVLAVNFIEF